jgi:hypothetical protein
MTQFTLDALLGRWPAQDPQAMDGVSWDERSEGIVRAALARKDKGSPSVVALLAAPRLEPENGEEKASSFQTALPSVARPTAKSERASKRIWAGAATAVLAIAAAFAIHETRQPEPAPSPALVQVDVEPTVRAAPTEAPKAAATAEAKIVAPAHPAPAATAVSKKDSAKGTGDNKDVGSAGGPPAAAVASSDAKPSSTESLPAPQDDGSLPAVSSNVPDQPPPGKVLAATRAVLPAARACVEGSPKPTTASVTFGSSGAVKSVSVDGWAAANGKADCVKSALRGARVDPFARPTFTVPVTVRASN